MLSGRQQSLNSGMPWLSWSSQNIINLSVPVKRHVAIGSWFQPELGLLLPTKSTKQNSNFWVFVARGQLLGLFYTFGRDIEWFIHPSVFSWCFSSFLSHFFSLFLLFSSFVFLPYPHRRSLSTTLAGRIWDCQRAPAVSPHTHGCLSSY